MHEDYGSPRTFLTNPAANFLSHHSEGVQCHPHPRLHADSHQQHLEGASSVRTQALSHVAKAHVRTGISNHYVVIVVLAFALTLPSAVSPLEVIDLDVVFEEIRQVCRHLMIVPGDVVLDLSIYCVAIIN
ncbi:hypothetical protein Bbelb_257060 [Branchiostoma belcheri]|nr:hypothetical protein Bbelb_257060 [Branchiostoma belcheri]